MLAEFISEHQLARIEVHFKGRKYKASEPKITKQRSVPLWEPSPDKIKEREFLHFIGDTALVDVIHNDRADHGSNIPEVDITISCDNNHRAFIRNAMLTSWHSPQMTALIDTIKFFADDTYELATDPILQKKFWRSKQINDTTFNRFYQILLEE